MKEFTFFYKGIGPLKKKVVGKIKAASMSLAKEKLKKQNIIVVSIKQQSSFLQSIPLNNRIRHDDITILTRQLATMVSADIPVVQSLQIAAKSVEKQPLVSLIENLKKDVESGLTLSGAMRKNNLLFDDLTCNLIAAGEQSGSLNVMLDRIATYKEKTSSLRRKIKKALYYPIAVLVIALIVTIVLLVKVVPTFEELFSGFGAGLPTFTVFVLELSNLTQQHGLKILSFLIILCFTLLKLYQKKASFQHFLQRVSLHIPVLGNILKKSIIARFARTLTTTFSAGLPLPEALQAVAKSSGNIVFYSGIMKVLEDVSAGQSMHVAMHNSNLFPNLVIQMVNIGEESGHLEEMLAKVANIFEEEVDLAVDGLTTLLEPIIMLILGVIIGGLVIAMYLPIFKLGSVI